MHPTLSHVPNTHGAAPHLIVIGGGPTAMAAATEAAGWGLHVTLLDERQSADRPRYHPRLDLHFGEAVWSLSGAFRVDTLGPSGPCHYSAPAVIVATGARERVIPFPGWTTEGVIDFAEAMHRLKSGSMRPRQRVLIAGCGPRLATIAGEIRQRGGVVLAVVDLASRREWLAALRSRPAKWAREIDRLNQMRQAGVAVLHRAAVTKVARHPTGLQVAVGRVDGAGRARAGGNFAPYVVDLVVASHGLAPNTDISRLMRADHTFDAARGFWHPIVDHVGRSSVPGLYIAGEAAGQAHVDGRATGLAVAHDMGRISPSKYIQIATQWHRKAISAARFARAIEALSAPRPGLVEAIPPHTIVCRCEAVTRADIDTAVQEGANHVNQLKAWTRCGMGRCQGRICADTAAALLATHGLAPEQAGQFTGRTPLRPLPLDLLTGEFNYADIALPPAAPL